MSDEADARARERILTDFATTLFVEAAAGTGKTTVLVGRIVALVRQGMGTLERIVAMTFTEKAAGEMKLRLRSEIELARGSASADERVRLEHALSQLELARIDTIHAFCGDLLRERPVEAGIDPLFAVAAEDAAQRLAEQAFEGWFEEILPDPPEGVRRVLRRRSKGGEEPRESLRNALTRLIEHRDFPGPWRRDAFDRNRQIDRLIAKLRSIGALAAESSWSDDYLTRNLFQVARFIEENDRPEAVQGRDHDALEAALRELARSPSWIWKGSAATIFGALSRDEVLARRDKTKEDLDSFIARCDADLAALLHEELGPAVARYETLKVKTGVLDFLDLMIKARDLVRENDAVRVELQNRFTHFFVDEFQDTDPLQAEILLLLCADDTEETDWRRVRTLPGKLFVVGDPKQSIYRFRRADVAIYEEVKRRVTATGAERLHLTKSFRAPPSMQSFVNAAFAPAMEAAPDGSQATYVALENARPEIAGRPTIIALPVPRPYSDRGRINTNRQIEASYPEAVGAFLHWLLNESGWTIEKESKLVQVRPRHICVLFHRLRNFASDVARPYVRALEARRIPHLLVGGRSFHDREEIIALCNALTAIEWPDDELKVFATLRGPFFAIGDEALLLYRQYLDPDGELHTRRLHPMKAVDAPEVDPTARPVVAALALLRQLHMGRNYRPIAETIVMLLGAVRAHAGIALWPSGEQALANCMRLVDMARRFEGGASSFRAFVDHLDADSKESGADEAPIVEEGTEGVRMMTVHKAKGLEFPVVILAEPAASVVRSRPSRHVEPSRQKWLEPLCGCAPVELIEAADGELRRDAAEGIRLAYVAVTRARDLLVAPVSGDEPIQGWLSVLNPVLYPAKDAKRRIEDAPGCPEFGEESVLDRGPKGKPPRGGSVRPGLHRSAAGGPPVTWWDPATLKLDVEEPAPLRQQHILEADPQGVATAAGEESYARWKADRNELLTQASKPLIRSERITTVAGASAADDRIEILKVEHRGARPGGRRFGALVHAALATVDLRADADAIRDAVALSARLVGADDETDAAISVVTAALGHPLLRQAASIADSADLRRETPVMMRLPDGSLVEGIADLAFRSSSPDFVGWIVIDFKTDREFEVSRAQYTAQVGLYVDAIAAATGSPTRGVLLVV
jgi:ATP-dependent exoDNAse (exonuclease V) beta subunit